MFQLTDGKIVNFIEIRKSKEIREFGVELFDSTGIFLKYSKLGENLRYNIRCMDKNNLFYAIDRKEFSKVISFKLLY